MAYSGSGLVLMSHGNDKKFYRYTSTADAMATIEAAGYFTNTTNSANRMSVGDTIEIRASNGLKMLEVGSVSAAGSVTLKVSMPDSRASSLLVPTTSTTLFNQPSTATELPASGLIVINTTSTASVTWTVAAPYAGAELKVFSLSSAPVTLHLSTAAGTTPTWDGTNSNVSSTLASQQLHVIGLSATRFGVLSNSTEAGAAVPMTFS